MRFSGVEILGFGKLCQPKAPDIQEPRPRTETLIAETLTVYIPRF